MYFLTVLLALITTSAFAKNHVAFLGGGGEPDGPKTIFDGDIPRFGKYVQSSEVELTVSFNGGHSRTEERLSTSFPGSSNTPFSPDAFRALIDRYENDIRSGKITQADQLMLFINTHGSEGQKGQLSHSIAASGGAIANYDRFEGPKSISLDRLQNLSKLAEEKGIRLAIVDLSCHSGASLPLSNSRTCVISASGPNLYGFAGSRTFSSNYMNKMRPGKNLEEIFHDVRDNSSHTDFPMISSGAGREVQDEIYPLLKRFLLDFDKGGPSKLSADILNSVTTNSCTQEDESLSTLVSLLSDVERAANKNFERLRNAVMEYQALRRELQDNIRGMVLNPLLSESRRFCDGGACVTYTGKEILSMDIDASIRFARESAIRTPSQAGFYRSWENSLNRAKAWKSELLANPSIAGLPDFFKNYPELERRSEKLASRISREERKLYREMYREKSPTVQGPNPCRDFRL